MDVGKQIKKFRQALKLSQEELPRKIFVTRQTLSTWETGTTYPDVTSLDTAIVNFSIATLASLVKADVIDMDKQVEQDDVPRFKRDYCYLYSFNHFNCCIGCPAVPLFRIVRDCIMAFNCRSYDILCNATEQTKKEQ